jgi:cytochrome c3-like protein
MGNIIYIYRTIAWIISFGLPAILLFPALSLGQGEEVASYINRYKQNEVITGYYERYEARPRNESPLVKRFRSVDREPFAYSSTASMVRNRSLLADSHRGIKFYDNRRCEACHVNETYDIHTTRANITCRQCHGPEPIASNNHYYSPMNPIRRHAYVCAKCHEGANASFATYVVHEPAAGAISTRDSFPAMYYSYWFMLILLTGTLAFFIPHSLLMGLRELFKTKKG